MSAFDYSGVWKRRSRVLRRLIRYAAAPRLYPRSPAVPFYWWDEDPNFGDRLTEWLLPKYGIMVMHRPAFMAAASGVGSIIEHLPADWSGSVLGSGMMFDRRLSMPNARFYAVRGGLTRDNLGLPDATPLGDLGLLVARHVKPRGTRWDVGIVPHYRHKGSAELRAIAERGGPRVKVIDVLRHPQSVALSVASCEVILSTSLHGLVTADSFGIPAAWAMLPGLEGGDYKFRDHETVVSPSTSRRIEITGNESLPTLRSLATPAQPRAVRATSERLERALVDFRIDASTCRLSPMKAWTLLSRRAPTYGSDENQWPRDDDPDEWIGPPR